MNYVESTPLRARGSHAGVLTLVALVLVCGLATMQSAPWINGFLHISDRPFIGSGTANSSSLSVDARSYRALPIVLTVPFAVARTQQMLALRLKRHQIATHIAQVPGIKGATGLIAGLALIQAVQASSSK